MKKPVIHFIATFKSNVFVLAVDTGRAGC